MLRPAVAVVLVASALFTLVGPVVFARWLVRRTDMTWRAWWIGAGTFVLFQCVLRLPWLVPLGRYLAPELRGHPWRQAAWLAFAALTAGVFEECGRWLALRHVVRGRPSWRVGVVMGAGHGGIESVLLVGVALAVTAALYVALLVGVPTGLPPAVIVELYKLFARLTPLEAALGAIERAGAMTFHVAMSMLVLEGFRRGAKRWLAAAIGCHFAINVLLVGVGSYLLHELKAPALVALVNVAFALPSVALIARLQRRMAREDGEERA